MIGSELKVGVMTWFSYENYGTALQAVALQEVLRSMGCTPSLINYRPRSTRSRNEPVGFSDLIGKTAGKIKRIIIDDSAAYSSPERSELFFSFISDHCLLTEPANSFPELKQVAHGLDCCICGSDQVWSPNCFDENYFLPFVEDPQRRISYAPSFGASNIADPEIERRTKSLLSDFGPLSVRETTGAEIVEKLTGHTPDVVVDPTLLLDLEGWGQLLGGKTSVGKGYILCYFLGDPERYEQSALTCSKALGLPLVSIPTVAGQKHSVGYEVGPEEYLRLFMGASYVLTDSFHGTAFSVNFGVPFSVFKRFSDRDPRSQNSRITSFLQLMGLEDRLVPSDFAGFTGECDFTDTKERLSRLRRESSLFLNSALSSIDQDGRDGRITRPVRITGQCCGCGACAAACPRGAISIDIDDDGFQSYSIDESLCVGCGICQGVCPMNVVKAKRVSDAKCLLSYQSHDSKGLTRSSSGGLGADLAGMLAERGYRVFGCIYDSENDAALTTEVDSLALDKLRGSKYIQSRSAEALATASAPSAGKIVFFGTPCQIAGLDSVLRRKGARDEAVLVDLICHGVPSGLLWTRYLADRESEGVGEHPDVYFRWKANGWSPQKMMMMISPSKDYSAVESEDDFYAFFSPGLCYAKSCYECPYRERSAADVRMGDYWGGRFAGDQKGVSMVIVMTDTGAKLMQELTSRGVKSEQFDLREYWDCQFPYNQGLPLIWDELIADLRDGVDPLSDLRRKHCAGFDQRKKIDAVKRTFKKLLGKA